jgi:hypothetical protein
MKHVASVLCAIFLSFCTNAMADDLDLLLPPNNVSSRPIIEFRARKPMSQDAAKEVGREASRVGHAYVLVGRELDNGTTLFNQVRGFYAVRDGEITLLQKMYTKGIVKQHLDDAASDITFRVYITPIQEMAVQKVFRDWNDKMYSLPIRNCVDFAKAVAKAVNLNIPEEVENPLPQLPVIFLEGLRQQNDKDTPLRAVTVLPNLPGAPGVVPSPAASPTGDPLAAARATQEQTQRALDAQRPLIPPAMPNPVPVPSVYPPLPPLPPQVVLPPPALPIPPRR